jgi:hypothetical protein
MGAGRGGASQYAAKIVMLTESPPGKAKAAGGTHGGEEASQQKRINGECADRGAPCNRPLPETPHPQSPRRLLSQSRSAKVVGVSGFEPPAPSSRTIVASLSGAKNQTKSAILILFGADQSHFVPLFLSVPVG